MSKMKQRMAAPVLGTVLAIAMALGASAQQPPAGGTGMGGMSGGPGGGFMARGQGNPEAIKTILDLDERQFTEMIELRDAHQAKLKEYSDEQRALTQEQRTIVSSSGADPAKLGSITLRQEALKQMIQQENDAYHTNALSLLTATQRDKVKAIEEALKLAPNAGALMQFGLLDAKALQGVRPGGFMGMRPGQTFRTPGGPPPQN